MGSTELQVFIALGVVLAAVLIAFAVDVLKGAHERLRERNAALEERGRAAEERARQAERLHRQLVELVEALKDAEQMRPVSVSGPMARQPVSRTPEPEPEAPREAVLELPDSHLVVQTPTPLPESPVAVRVVSDEEEFIGSDELIEELPPMAELAAGDGLLPAPCGRKTRRFVTPARPISIEAGETVLPLSKLVVEPPCWEDWLTTATAPEQAEAEPAAPEPAEAAEQTVVEQTQQVPPEPPAVEERLPEIAEPKVVEMPLPPPPAAEDAQLAVPSGIQPPEVLTELLKQEIDFQGVTLSISVVDYVRLVAENGKESVERVMSALEGLVQSSGNSTDLVCRISEDEFIVVCPGATGAAATERVQQLSENLWDFQLRSLVSFPILFSWGASECGLMPGMPRLLADSIDRAREQMLETRRSRRALTWASAKYGLQSSAG
ncbi:MAG: diguanylate cyclase [Bryobacteraceae bacterium]|nr:diguanylate cyclase [Bryobacteraceae bacterium]